MMGIFHNSCASLVISMTNESLRFGYSEVLSEETYSSLREHSYVHEFSAEPRSKSLLGVDEFASSVNSCPVRSLESSRLSFETTSEEVSLRNATALKLALGRAAGSEVVLDITGMPHNTWAPLVKVGLDLDADLKVIYSEPQEYRAAEFPQDDDIFDLSERINGVSPIPQFAKISDFDERSTRVIAMLGFEGARFKYLLNEIQPESSDIFPIIGAPGFRIEYPFLALQCNGAAIEKWDIQGNIRYAASNSPFSAFYEIESIVNSGGDSHNKIGLVGTKPHALGAVLTALLSSSSVELVYDQVVKKAGRTTGVGTSHLYHVGRFVNDVNRPARSANDAA